MTRTVRCVSSWLPHSKHHAATASPEQFSFVDMLVRLMSDGRGIICRSLVSNQDDFDMAWPDPLSLTHYNWRYKEKEIHGVIR